MDSEDLYVSRDHVKVKYRFTNTSDAPIDTLVAFPLPDIPPGTENDETRYISDPTSSLKFRTTADGQAIPLTLVEQAIFSNRDVSTRLMALHVPLNRLSDGFAAALNHMPAGDRDALIADGLIRDGGQGGDKPDWLGLWNLKTTLTRHQKFPAGKTVTVEHEYVPIVGGSVGGYFDPQLRNQSDMTASFSEKRRRYCIDDDWLLSFDRKLASQGPVEGMQYSEVWIGYVLKTGANWKGPIGDFRVVIDKGKPNSLVSFCGQDVRKVSATQFEMRRTNFTPRSDLDILIIDWAR
jgi:hypothetical protein